MYDLLIIVFVTYKTIPSWRFPTILNYNKLEIKINYLAKYPLKIVQHCTTLFNIWTLQMVTRGLNPVVARTGITLAGRGMHGANKLNACGCKKINILFSWHSHANTLHGYEKSPLTWSDKELQNNNKLLALMVKEFRCWSTQNP